MMPEVILGDQETCFAFKVIIGSKEKDKFFIVIQANNLLYKMICSVLGRLTFLL